MTLFKKALMIIALLILESCGSKIDVIFSSENEINNYYTVNFDGVGVYGLLDTLWMPTGTNWEIEIKLVWDSAKSANTYPISSTTSATSIYIDSSGLPLFKFEGQYISANISRLVSGTPATFKFSVSATHVKHYMNGILEGTIATSKSLISSWEVIGAHSSRSLNYMGKIYYIKLIDMDDPTNSRDINLKFSAKNSSMVTEDEIRNSTNISFLFSNTNKLITY